MEIRADHVNEDYYARRNAPTSNQFVGSYHFVDDTGRQYMIAEKNKQVFQNKRLQFKPHTKTKKKECVVNTHGYVKLYVKLPNTRTIHWFKSKETNKPLYLHAVNVTEPIYQVILKSSDKPDHRSATGSIFVSSLSPILCNAILNTL